MTELMHVSMVSPESDCASILAVVCFEHLSRRRSVLQRLHFPNVSVVAVTFDLHA